MIRAFAIGLAVGTIRIWVGVFNDSSSCRSRTAFGVAFWLSFLLHALVAEAYLSKATERARHAGPRTHGVTQKSL
jgi:hypothetical protein